MAERTRPAGSDGDDDPNGVSRRLREARAKAARYDEELPEAHNGTSADEGADAPQQPEEQPPPRLMSEWSDLVSQRIEDAMRRGVFDNLAVKGKPLDLERSPFVSAEQQTAFNLLKNNDLIPEWIAARREVLESRDKLRSELKQAVGAIRHEMENAPDNEERLRLNAAWKRWLNGWHSRMEDLNYRIMIQNLKQPIRHLETLSTAAARRAGPRRADAAWQFDLR